MMLLISGFQFVYADQLALDHQNNSQLELSSVQGLARRIPMLRVRRSFSVEAKRCEKLANFFSLRSEKKSFFRLFRFEAKHWKSQAKRKRAERKDPSET
jgi:hypothetical protein